MQLKLQRTRLLNIEISILRSSSLHALPLKSFGNAIVPIRKCSLVCQACRRSLRGENVDWQIVFWLSAFRLQYDKNL